MTGAGGFGRRIVQPGGRELVLFPPRSSSGAAADLSGRAELKEQICTALMARIDASVDRSGDA